MDLASPLKKLNIQILAGYAMRRDIIDTSDRKVDVSYVNSKVLRYKYGNTIALMHKAYDPAENST